MARFQLPIRRLAAPGSPPSAPRSWLGLLCALVALPAILGAPGVARAAETDGFRDPAEQTRTHVLPNGLTVLTLEDHATPVVSFQMWVRAGSRDEGFYTGVAHLFEHMMFKGSRNIGPEEHARLIVARGGRVNAYTSRDVTVYHEDVTSETLPLVIDLEAERVINLDISQHTLDTEREVVIEERRMRLEDSPGGLAFAELAALAWQAHPYRWPVIGWRADLEAMTVAACRQFFDTYYSAGNIVLVIVGDFETQETLAHIERAFSRLRVAETIPRNPGRVVPQRGERRSTIEYDVRVPLLYASWHAPKSGHPDSEALDVTSRILSGGRSSRLYRQLVYESEQALYAEGGYWELQDAGLFYAVAGVRPGVAVDEVEAAFFAVVDRIAREGVSEEEVAKAKRQLEVALVNGLSTAHSLSARLGNDYVSFGRIRSLDERLGAIDAVTPADVQRVVSQYLVQSQRSVVQVVPPPPAAAGDGGEAK